VLLGNTLVHETCRKHKIITRNSTEAELVALSDHIQEGELIEEFLLDMSALCDFEVLDNVHLVYQDNKPTITIVTTGGGKARTKYMKVREEYVKEQRTLRNEGVGVRICSNPPYVGRCPY